MRKYLRSGLSRVALCGLGVPDLTPFPPPSNPGRVGAPPDGSRNAALILPARNENDPMPRRNNVRKGQGRQSEVANRVAGLGSHWRADGLPKTAYATQGDALTAALVRRQESGVELSVYLCDVCSAWHMGNPRTQDW